MEAGSWTGGPCGRPPRSALVAGEDTLPPPMEAGDSEDEDGEDTPPFGWWGVPTPARLAAAAAAEAAMANMAWWWTLPRPLPGEEELAASVSEEERGEKSGEAPKQKKISLILNF